MIITLCGSTKFKPRFVEVKKNLKVTESLWKCRQYSVKQTK